MEKRRTPQTPANSAEQQSEELLYEALLLSGAIIPTTPDEVALVESRALDQGPLPVRFQDPQLFLEAKRIRKDRGAARVRFDNNSVNELARAAREGGTIPSEIEARMKEAREKADNEYDSH